MSPEAQARREASRIHSVAIQESRRNADWLGEPRYEDAGRHIRRLGEQIDFIGAGLISSREAQIVELNPPEKRGEMGSYVKVRIHDTGERYCARIDHYAWDTCTTKWVPQPRAHC